MQEIGHRLPMSLLSLTSQDIFAICEKKWFIKIKRRKNVWVYFFFFKSSKRRVRSSKSTSSPPALFPPGTLSGKLGRSVGTVGRTGKLSPDDGRGAGALGGGSVGPGPRTDNKTSRWSLLGILFTMVWKSLRKKQKNKNTFVTICKQ